MNALCLRLALASLCVTAVAMAQEEQSPVITLPDAPPSVPQAPPERALTLESIVVTGSRIPRTEQESVQPVVRIEQADIARSGAASVAELLHQLVFTGAAASRSAPSSEEASQNVNLRGIGAERTLVLLNGRRLGGGLFFFNTAASDLSVIPLAAIERIEVLKDGASAIYGSDAVSGVVNIITRSDFRGLQGRAQVGGFAAGDGFTRSLGLAAGAQFGGTALLVDLSYGEDDAVLRRDRALTRFPVFGAGPTRGSFHSPRGALSFVPSTDNAALFGPELCPDQGGVPLCTIVLRPGETITGAPTESTATVAARYEAFNSDSLDPAVNDLFNPHEGLALAHPSRRSSLFATLDHRFAAGPGLHGELLYTRRALSLPDAASVGFGDFLGPRFDDIYVAADQRFNPFDQDIGRGDPMSGIGSGAVLRTLSEVPATGFLTRIDAYRVGLAFDGALPGSGFGWEAGLVYGASRSDATQRVRPHFDHLALALGPAADCAAVAGCVPLNIFGAPGTITPEMLDYATYVASYPKQQSLALGHATLSGDLLPLPAGPLEAALGLEVRHERYADRPDALIANCRTSACFSATDGSFAVRESFAELRLPLLAERRFATALDLSLALRYSDYTAFGSATTHKLGLAWRLQDDLLLRASRSTAFRAPSISNAFLSAASFFLNLADPCSDYLGAGGGAPAEATVQSNCRADGVPDDYVQQGPIPANDGGNPTLVPETAVTLNAGLLYTPRWLPGLKLAADWYRIALDEVILILSPQLGLDACYGTAGGGQTCSLLSRDPVSGAIDLLRLTPLNLGAGAVQGVDFTLDYSLPAGVWGEFRFGLQGAYQAKVTATLLNSDGSEQVLTFQGTSGLAGAFPRWRANAALSWRRGALAASWTSRYIHRQIEPCDDGIAPSFTALGLCSQPDTENPALSTNELEALIYHDLQLGYTLTGGTTTLTLGVNNLLNRDPPPSYANSRNAYDAETYDLPGRFGYLGVNLSF